MLVIKAPIQIPYRTLEGTLIIPPQEEPHSNYKGPYIDPLL